jgi:hypothetical protein
MHLTRWPIVAVLSCALTGVAAASSAATTLAIAQPGPTTVSALGDRVVFSQPIPSSPRRYILVQAAAGGPVAAIPGIAAQSTPFDVDLGTDTKGQTIAMYSRCSRASARVYPFGAGLPRRDLAQRCRIKQYDFASGRETSVGGLREPSWASDYLPTRWGSLLAFARRDSRLKRTNPKAVTVRIVDLANGHSWRKHGGPTGYIDPILTVGGPGPVAIDLRGGRLAYNWGWSPGAAGCPVGPDTGHVAPFATQIWVDGTRSRGHRKIAQACAEITSDSSVEGVALTSAGLIYGRNRNGGSVVLHPFSGSDTTLVSGLATVTSVAANDDAGFATTQIDQQKLIVFPFALGRAAARPMRAREFSQSAALTPAPRNKQQVSE